MFVRPASRARRCFVSYTLVALTASSVFAWAPKTHLYLTEAALRDALSDSKVDIRDTGGALIGAYDCNPALIRAIKAYPAQFRAGSIGADAYPDIATGRQLIRPSYPGTDSWLNYLWSTTSGGEGGDRAFAAGFSASAAGDLFGSSFINSYAGGSPESGSGTEKQEILENLVDKQMPEPRNYDGSGALGESDVSVQGEAGKLIYEKMVDARPGTVLRNLLAGDSAKNSIPAVYSSLKYGLVADTASYHATVRDLDARYEKAKSAGDACGLLDLSCSKMLLYAEAAGCKVARAAVELTQGPIILYKEAWIKDIEEGLIAWPSVSHEINLAIHLGDSAQISRARTAASQFVTNHLISMGGAPDALGSTLDFISSVLTDMLPGFMRSAMTKMKDELLDFMFKSAFGKTADQWGALAKDPESAAGGAGINAADFRSGGLNAPPSTDTIKYQDVAAMRNSETMIKLSLMSRSGVNKLLRDLGDAADSLTEENIMLGSWFGSQDESRQWASSCRTKRMVLAKVDSIFYKIFKRQPGDNDEYCTSGAPSIDSNVVVFNTPMAGRNDLSQNPPVNKRRLKLTMPFDGSLRVDCRGADAIAQPYLYLFEEDSTTSLGAGHEDPTAVQSSMVMEIPSLRQGRYVLELYFYNPASYTLLASPKRHVGNDREPNDTVRQAIHIGRDSTYTGWIGDCGGYRTDAGDWYTITLPQAAHYSLSMVSDTTMVPKIVLYDQDTTTELPVNGYLGREGYTTLTTPLLTAGTYFVWATGYGFGGYSLTSSLVLACATDFEPNDAVSQSTRLPLDSTITAKIGQMGGGVSDDNDWYAVTIGSGALRIILESSPDLYASLTLYGPDSSAVVGSDAELAPTKEIARQNLDAGTYFVNVYRYVGQGCYQLTASASQITGTAKEFSSLNANGRPLRVAAQRISYAFTASQSGPAQVLVYDMSGRLRMTCPLGSLAIGQFRSGSLPVGSLPRGVMCVRLTTGSTVVASERLLVR